MSHFITGRDLGDEDDGEEKRKKLWANTVRPKLEDADPVLIDLEDDVDTPTIVPVGKGF